MTNIHTTLDRKSLYELLRGFKHGLLVFTSSQCINCEHQRYILDSYKLPEGVNLIEIDVDKNIELVRLYAATKVPTLVLVDATSFKGLSMRVGITGRAELNKLMELSDG